MIKIITVDDHILFSEAVKKVIEGFNDNIQVIKQFYSGQEIINYCSKCKELPDIILMGIQMPVINGIEATEWLKINQPGIKVIALTMQDRKEIMIKMINAGAKSYLLKDIKYNDLHKAIIETHHKGFYNSKYLLESGLHIN